MIKDWSDLVRDDVKVVFPNPKTSGNGRYTYLAAYAYALEANKGDQEKAKEFVRKLFANVPVFDTGGRAGPLRSSSTALVTCSSPSRPKCRASEASTARTRPIS